MSYVLRVDLVEIDGKPSINYDSKAPLAPSLDDLLLVAGRLRAETQPPVERAQPGAVRHVDLQERDSMWTVGQLPDGEAILSLRHPGFGWLDFHLSSHSVAQLHQLLGTLGKTEG